MRRVARNSAGKLLGLVAVFAALSVAGCGGWRSDARATARNLAEYQRHQKETPRQLTDSIHTYLSYQQELFGEAKADLLAYQRHQKAKPRLLARSMRR